MSGKSIRLPEVPQTKQVIPPSCGGRAKAEDAPIESYRPRVLHLQARVAPAEGRTPDARAVGTRAGGDGASSMAEIATTTAYRVNRLGQTFKSGTRGERVQPQQE